MPTRFRSHLIVSVGVRFDSSVVSAIVVVTPSILETCVAMASSHAHDAHNVVVVGMTDEDMAAAANHLRAIGGGQVVVMGGRVVAELPCPIGGLLSDLTFEEVADRARVLEEAAGELGTTLPSPFMAMSFLALSVIPELKLTDRGLVDVDRFELVPLQI